MITDHLRNGARYAGVLPGLDRAFAFLRATDLLRLDEGRHVIDGDRVFALVQSYRPRPAAEGRWEAHVRHADIQVLAAGVERVGYADVRSLAPETPYDAEKDVAFYRGTGDLLTLRPGHFMFFGPEDAHMPCLEAEGTAPVRKIVVKVRCRD